MYFRFYVVVMFLALVPHSLAQSDKVCRDEGLPSQVQLQLGNKFRNWRPKQLSDLSEYDRKLWLEAHPKECPGLATGHFEQRDRVAYAILLIPKSGHTASYKIVVLSKVGKEYAARLLDHAEGGAGSDPGLVISKKARGTYSDFGGTKSVRLKLDAVNAEWLEKSSVLY